MSTTSPSGLRCPECGQPIPVSIPLLLHGAGLPCVCGLVLHVDRAASRPALDALARLEAGMAKAQAKTSAKLR